LGSENDDVDKDQLDNVSMNGEEVDQTRKLTPKVENATEIVPSEETKLSPGTEKRSIKGSQDTLIKDDKDGWCRNKRFIRKTPNGYECMLCEKTYGR